MSAIVMTRQYISCKWQGVKVNLQPVKEYSHYVETEILC